MYAVDVSALRGREGAALALLSPERHEKALRIKRESARLLSIGAALLLRKYIGDTPLILSPEGKPRAEGAPCFNLSHSGTLAVLAVAPNDVGADTECITPPRRALFPRVFTMEESAYIADDAERFTRLWTRKEAVLKCCGCGISRAMNDFSVLTDTATMDGTAYFLHSERYRDSVISAACTEGDPRFTVIEVSADDLLR